MNLIAEEMRAVLEGDGDALAHYGTKFHSGRYPYGSGEDPYQHGGDFLSRVEKLKKEGWKETAENVRNEFGISLEEYRNEKSWANYTRRELNVSRAKNLRDQGFNISEIGRQMDVNESTVRSWLDPKREERMQAAKNTADMIKQRIDETGKMVMLGTGVERELGVSRTNLDLAVYALEAEGYVMQRGRYEQATNWGNWTTVEALGPPGTKPGTMYDPDNIVSLNDYVSHDGGATFKKKFTYPESLDSKRLQVRYNEEGGAEKDGIIELRRGVDDLSLGESRYSQVRIMVDGTHYLKGMAVYSDDMPDGVDVIFNTNKTKGTPLNKVLKEVKDDPDNPFGSLIKDSELGGQYWYTDKNGKEKLGLINKRADEGDWGEWKDTLSSQFLSKQSLTLIKKQLKQATDETLDEYASIQEITNPTVKKYYLNKFAEECDSAAVHLKAAALPGQKYHVILPVNSLKENEVYAPQYENGSEVVLVRYPHGGTFEIPVLKVNNKNADAKKLIGTDAGDAICINHKVAERLSGADFDGDTVMCIPTKDASGKVKVRITSTDPLKQLEGFDAKVEYAEREGMKYMKNPVTGKDSTQVQMGMISNLITDMTLAGAPKDELARAVKHSMVVIDAAKHKLDYKRSETENGIAALHKKYQGHYDENGKWHNKGAGTIVSRASGEVDVDKRIGSAKVNLKGKSWYDPTKEEGALIYKDDPDASYTYIKTNKRTGEVTEVTKTRTQKSTRMMETDDANTLVSDMRHPKELAYADYANHMKTLANQARKEAATTKDIEYDKNAAQTYKSEVASLKEKLNTALLNAPRERYAQIKATGEVNAKKQAYQESTGSKMKTSDVKKASQQALTKYREEAGSVSRSKRSIKITDKEWEAIQAGAIPKTDLIKILNNSDPDVLRDKATPKATNTISAAKQTRIKNLNASGKTIAEIASALNVSASTVQKYLKGAS